MKTLKKLAIAATLAIAPLSAASAQMHGQPQSGGYPQQVGGYPQQQKQHAPDSAYTGVQGVSPQTAALFTNTSYREIEGQMMAVAVYAPDGACQVTIGGRTGGQSVTTQSCRYAVRELGNGRIAMAAKATINGQTVSDVATLRIRPDGSLMDEKTRTVSVRIQ